MFRRKNPGPRGFPHKNKKLLETSKVFENEYDVVRSIHQLDERIPAKEMLESAKERLKGKFKGEAEKEKIANLEEIVDFGRHVENLASFKYDLEGFLEALKTLLSDPKERQVATDLYNQYSVVYKKLSSLIRSLKELD